MSARGLGASFLLIAASHHLAAQSCTSQLYPSNSAGSISVVSSDPHITSGVVAGGVGMWQSCSQSGSGFPSLVTTGSADMSVDVVLLGGVSILLALTRLEDAGRAYPKTVSIDQVHLAQRLQLIKDYRRKHRIAQTWHQF
jgi:hypothetical protein